MLQNRSGEMAQMEWERELGVERNRGRDELQNRMGIGHIMK